MSEKERGLNLPAVRKADGLVKPNSKEISTLDLSKKSAVGSVLNGEHSSVQKDILQMDRGLDLVLVGDLTGSMRDYHSLLKKKFVDLCNELFPLIQNLKIGIIFYLDHGSGDPYITRVQKLTVSAQELINFVNSTSTGSGGDDDEAVEDALNDLLQNMNWKESNSRSVVIFGDASPHRVHQCPHQHDFFNLTKQLYKMGVTINSVYCRNYPQGALQKLENINVGDFSSKIAYLQPPNFFSWIANVTGGMVIGIEKIEDLVDIIKASAAKDSGHLDDLEKKMKATSPNKLNLIEVAKKAEQRRKLAGERKKVLN
jgi:hypothetical protein